MKNIFTFLVGALSGVLAYILRSDYLTDLLRPLGLSSNIDLLELISIYLPGFIFGLFSIPFIWNYTRSFWKTIVWFLGSGISFIAAFWTGFAVVCFMDGINIGDLVTFVIVYAVAGLIGTGILLLTFRIILGSITKNSLLIILFFGSLIPGVLLLFFGVELSKGSFISMPVPKKPYEIVMMILWQGFMLLAFIKLLNNPKDNNKYQLKNSY